MATLTIPNTFIDATTAEAAEVNANFSAVKSFIDTEVIQRDGSVAFTALVSGPSTDPTASNHLARKQYVDTQVATRALTSHSHSGSDITSGTVAAARLPAISSLSGTATTGQIPNLAASKITSGTFDNARIPASMTGKTLVQATRLDAGSGGLTFNNASGDILDYDNILTGLWSFQKTGNAFPSVTIGDQGFTFPDLGLNNKMAFNWNGSGLQVYSNGSLVATLTT